MTSQKNKIPSNTDITWTQLISKSKWALVWFVTVSMICLMVWSIKNQKTPIKNHISKVAEESVELSLGSEDSLKKLEEVMTKKAFQQMKSDRGVAGLDTVNHSEATIKTHAWTRKVFMNKNQWIAMGLVDVDVKNKKEEKEKWQGVWRAVLEEDQQEWKVDRLSIQSLNHKNINKEDLFNEIDHEYSSLKMDPNFNKAQRN